MFQSYLRDGGITMPDNRSVCTNCGEIEEFGPCRCMRDEIQDSINIIKNNEKNVKDSNPKDAIGIKKVPFSTIPGQVEGEIGLALFEGARKYGKYNYRAIGVRYSVYYDATMRHLKSWHEGQDIDPDSGLNHITKAIAGLIVLRDSMLQENAIDDRPPKAKNQNWIVDQNKKAAEIIDRYPNAIEPYTEINKK
jgi:hypothetical protein